MTVAGQEGGLWRPANGTEGQDFEINWCRHCLHDTGQDWEDEFGNDVEYWCPILSGAQIGGGAKEWVWRDGAPHCTAFREDPGNPARCLKTKEMEL